MTKWVTKTLLQLADYHNGMAFKPSDWAEEGSKIIRIEQLNNPLGHYDYYKGEYPEINAISNGDLIFSWSATLKVCIWQWGDGVLNQHLFKVVPFKDIDKTYLLYLLDYNMPKLSESSHGSTMKHIKRKELETYTVSIPALPDGTPDLAEQRRIAGILSSADGAIAASEALIAKYRNIKRGLLATLLQPKEGWKKVKLGECLTRLCNGLTYDVEEKSGYMVTRIETISNDDIDYNRVGHIRTLPKQEYRIQKGDILFSHINSVKHIGKVAYFDDEQELYHGMNLLLMRFHESCDSKFFFYMLSSEKVRKRMRSLAKSAVNQASINTTELHNFTISYPESLAEQRRIADILSSVDAKIAAEEKVVEKYKGVKKGLMESMMKEK